MFAQGYFLSLGSVSFLGCFSDGLALLVLIFLVHYALSMSDDLIYVIFISRYYINVQFYTNADIGN